MVKHGNRNCKLRWICPLKLLFLHGGVTPQRPPAVHPAKPKNRVRKKTKKKHLTSIFSKFYFSCDRSWQQQQLKNCRRFIETKENIFLFFQLPTNLWYVVFFLKFGKVIFLSFVFFKVNYFFPLRIVTTWYRKNNKKFFIATGHTRRLFLDVFIDFYLLSFKWH